MTPSVRGHCSSPPSTVSPCLFSEWVRIFRIRGRITGQQLQQAADRASSHERWIDFKAYHMPALSQTRITTDLTDEIEKTVLTVGVGALLTGE